MKFKENIEMPGILQRNNMSIEQMIRIFKKQIENAGTLKELKARAHYEKPSVKRKKKRILAKKRAQKMSSMNS